MSNSPGAAATTAPIPVRFADGVLDPDGQNPKHRRVVILTPNDALAKGAPVVAGPVTSRIPTIPGPEHVVLPIKNPPGSRHPATGLTRRAGIVATWLVGVDRQAITGKSGYVPRRTMELIHAKTDATARALGGWP